MKVKYIGTEFLGTAFKPDKEYEVISIERRCYRIMTELEEDYLFGPQLFEVTDDTDHPKDLYLDK